MHCLCCCLTLPLTLSEAAYKNCIDEKKIKALNGFTLPEKPEDMILQYSKHRSPKDILDNYQEDTDLTNLIKTINKLKENNIKKFLQNLYDKDSSADKNDFKKLVYRISQPNNDLKNKLEKISFDKEKQNIFTINPLSCCANESQKIVIRDVIANASKKDNFPSFNPIEIDEFCNKENKLPKNEPNNTRSIKLVNWELSQN